jgi:Ca-activated chloride channel homolog
MSCSARSTSCLVICLSLATFGSEIFAQTAIDQVHISTRASSMQLATASPIPRPADDPLIRTSADLVMVPVTIIDSLNRPVIGLGEENFRLFENKKPQEIKNFSSEDAPVSIGIVIDTSGSMASKLERAQEAVRQFCEAANPQDEFFMITFADSPRLATDFTSRPEEIENALLTTTAKGRTSLLDAIYMAIRRMQNARYARRAILILSDGGDNHSRYSEHDVRAVVKEADVLVYAVGTYDRYFNTQEELLGPELLRSISESTGGQAFTLTDVRDLPDVTRLIGNQLRHQYMLAYRPQTEDKDGKWHKISVKLRLPKRLHALLHVEAREGYYAAER